MESLPHTDFHNAFKDGSVFHCPERGRLAVRCFDIGELILPSGKIVTCDPGNIGWEYPSIEPLVPSQRPGRYPVRVSVVTHEDWKHPNPRIACAMAVFTDERVTRWEMALTAEQSSRSLRKGQFFGYGVDVGVGCFVDAATLMAIGEIDPERFYEDRILPAIVDTDWSCVTLDPNTLGNIVMFSSGYGDGGYCSYWGRDKNGRVSCLATDFALLVENLEGKVTFRMKSLLDGTADLGQLADVGIRIEVDPRPDPRAFPDQNGCCVRMHGGTCRVVIHNANNEYCSDRFGYSSSNGVGTYNFRFQEELNLNAKVRFEFGLGVRALKTCDSL